jgi:hypothetical protein
MEKKIVARIIIIVIFIALLVYVLLQYTNIFPEIYDPFSEKVRLVRNYACSLAICTRGCGDSMLSKRMCIERDPGTGGCKKWCQDICEENDWLGGKHCGENYQINLTLKSQVDLKGAYDIEPTKDLSSYVWDTEIEDIINFLNRTEHFTNLWDLLPFPSAQCTKRITPPYTAPNGDGCGWAWGFGLINWENAAFRWGGQWYSMIEGGGDIILDPVEAHKLYNCFQKWPSTYDWQRNTKRGYYSCEFTGSMRIWSFVDSYPEGCADVSLRAIEPPFAGDFVLWPEPDSRTIPLENQDTFKIQITNSLGSDEPFSLKTESIDGIDCTFEGDGTLYVENTKTNGITMTCTPTLPPSGYGSYIVVITAEGGGKSRVTKVNVAVTDFSIDVKPDYSREADVGVPLGYTVEIENKLGKTADFTVSILSPRVDCSFDKNDWGNVLDGEKRTDTMICKPTSGGTHDVTVKASYGSLEHEKTVQIITPLCSVDSDGLKLKFFRGLREVTEVTSSDDFTIQASGFSGCKNKFVDFYVNPGMYVSHQQVEPSGSECKISKTAGTPESYEFYAVMIVNGVEYKTSDTTLTITKPSIDAKEDCKKWNDEWCAFSFHGCNWPWYADTICEHCKWVLGGGGKCTNTYDPQTCWQDPKTDACADYSNICCANSKDYYSPGPENGPACLSPDTNTNNEQNNYFKWDHTANARNVLVKDGYSAEIKCSDWLEIKISDTGRPVYGIKIIAKGYSWWFHLYIQNSTGNWITVKKWEVINPDPYQEFNYIPSQWAWNDIIRIKIVPNTPEGCGDITTLDVDYIGLLTKGGIPYCTEGNANDYYRTVDDGKNCYWGLDCPIENSGGWEWEPPKSTVIGPLTDVGCDCSSGSCGNGYCEFKDINKETFCYYGVRCMHGGWNSPPGNVVKCDPGKCRYNGCEV